MIGIIDYGLGNVHAFKNIYAMLNIPCRLVSSESDFDGVTHLILPGVGSFDWAMHRLNCSGMLSNIQSLIFSKNIPILGVCVGMQIMADCSDEGTSPGLSWIRGTVKHFSSLTQSIEVSSLSSSSDLFYFPHMGWNSIQNNSHPLFEGLDSPYFYFLHSYCFVPELSSSILSTSSYNTSFCSSVSSGNIFGVQFHPEKSHDSGVKLLSNFASL